VILAVALAALLATTFGLPQPAQVQVGEAPVVGAVNEPADTLALLADDGRWDELLDQATQRLSRDESDVLALYWSARAEIQRGLPLIGGRAFARDLGHTMLRRAGEQLALLRENPADATRDSREWAMYVRYLLGDDELLAPSLEAWFAESGRGYAAFLRGLMGRDSGDTAGALDWMGKAFHASPGSGDFAVEFARELGRAGRKEEALAAWSTAVADGVPLPTLLAVLLDVLPGMENAEKRLAMQDSLVIDEVARRDGLLAWHRSWSLEQLGRTVEAASALDAATEHRGAEVERAHARLLIALGRRAEAADRLRTAAGAGDAAAFSDLVSLADWHALAHAWDEAFLLYDAALIIEPRDERAAVNRALTMAQSGLSLAAWLDLVDRNPERADLLNDAALQLKGWGLDREAEAMFERASILPGALDARQNLADLLLNAHPVDVERAMSLLRDVVSGDPSREWALYLLHVARRANSR